MKADVDKQSPANVAAKEKQWQEYKAIWSRKTTKQVEKELKSWHAYMSRHSGAYAWHGADMTPPGELADGDKVLILRIILDEKRKAGE